MNVRSIPIKDIIPYENNVKVHPVRQLESIVQSIKTFGFRQPLVIDKNKVIVAGHARYEAASTLGMESVPCEMADELSPEQINAYRILDNEIAKMGTTNTEALNLEIAKLPDFDFEPFNLDIPELNKPIEGLCDPDYVPEIVNAEPIAKMGDIWLLGNHRLMCGDATMIDQVDKLMNGEKAELLFTSPPYSDMRKYSGNNLSLEKITLIFSSFYQKVNFYAINLGLQFKNNEINPYWNLWIDSAKNHGLKLLSWNVWDKIQAGSISNQSQMFALSHEWIFVFGEKPKKLNRIWEKSKDSEKRQKYFKVNDKGQKIRSVRQADGSMEMSVYGRDFDSKNMGSVITQYSEQERSINHPAKYPVRLPQPYIESLTKENEIVIDCFGGSGTTLIACEKTNRKCFMMEISPQYCDVIVSRWEKFTGKKAKLECHDND